MNLYNRIFLKFLISSILVSNAYAQTTDTLTTAASQLGELIFPLLIIMAAMFTVKFLFSFFKNDSQEFYLTRQKFEQSLKQSKEALEGINPHYKPMNFISPLFVSEKKIDTLISQIINKSKILVGDTAIDGKDKYLAEKSVSSYMPKVIESYKRISPTMRYIKGDNSHSAHDMTVEQLELIIRGLDNIELNLLAKKQDSLKASGKFLNQVFYQKNEFEELEM
jgi:hypothetical protein